ncbi:S-formylglutathione hydrolase FrmB [Kibdelosporangium banguiense]|uniref:S-formylglutathione hydrolase FrmB n=1 Tax=Kibdelosporangium banguiense TaxID=1365924 RepID=A0ABS4TNY0_9PSEU|nr:alpha/beta hydrolase family protein [Kibdelosporangium banguiense]MBP2326084.1 S-formylglutathione hydrolase FrmB [Kibdelosporangium banguiense]
MGTEVVAERFAQPNVVELDVRSPVLNTTVTVLLVTPSDWSSGTQRDWPTLYLLHGGDDGPSCWLEKTDIVSRAQAYPGGLLVVLPEGGRAGFYTDWRGPQSPAWHRFHTVELRSLLEAGYGAGPSRAVAGVSMGGYGAVMYAARNPGMFQAAASYSGLLHTTRRGVPLLMRYFLRSVGERIGAMWGARWSQHAVWAANNPYRLAERLTGTPLYVSAGDGVRVPGDPPAPGDRLLERLIAPTSHDFAERMAAIGHPVCTSFGPGTHDWPSWQRELDRSWGFLTTALTQGDKCA